MNKNNIKYQQLTGDYIGERALYHQNNIEVIDSKFHDGESPLKEGNNIIVNKCTFLWRYPLWYINNLLIKDSYFSIDTRAGLWYCNHVEFNDNNIEAPKWIRECNDVVLNNTKINGAETLWYSNNIKINNCEFSGDYLLLNSSDIKINNLKLVGKYSFQRCHNLEISNSYLDTKDAFWDCNNVIVKDSYVKGEYLAWNTKNITFINCTIESLQGLCYIKNLKLINCKMVNTSLCFEYCENINAEVNSHIDSITNPINGVIKCDSVGEMIIDKTLVDPNKTKIYIDGKKYEYR